MRPPQKFLCYHPSLTSLLSSPGKIFLLQRLAKMGAPKVPADVAAEPGGQGEPVAPLHLPGLPPGLPRRVHPEAAHLAEHQRAFEEFAATKEQALALQEQKIHALSDELRRALDSQRGGETAKQESKAQPHETRPPQL